MNHKRVLLIGASGFVSGALARAALAQGYEVWGVTRGRRPLPEGVSPIVADRHQQKEFADAVKRAGETWDLVVDCIAYEPADARQDIELFCDSAQQFVFISTDFVFDPFHKRVLQSEDSDFYLREGYGGKKRLCELEFISATSMAWTIFRPCHIYGPGSLLGCLPLHSRDPVLIQRMKEGQPLKLIGGGYFLQQPIFVQDLAELILSAVDNPVTPRRIFQAAGPEMIESHEYYRIIAERLGVELRVAEYPVERFLAEKPDQASFACHRIYDLSKLRESGLRVPTMRLREGLRLHLESLQLA
jgi:nucleoside-diphosphate-sugar epimerase